MPKLRRVHQEDLVLHSDVEFPPIFHPDVKIEDTNYFICTDNTIARLHQSAVLVGIGYPTDLHARDCRVLFVGTHILNCSV